MSASTTSSFVANCCVVSARNNVFFFSLGRESGRAPMLEAHLLPFHFCHNIENFCSMTTADEKEQRRSNSSHSGGYTRALRFFSQHWKWRQRR